MNYLKTAFQIVSQPKKFFKKLNKIKFVETVKFVFFFIILTQPLMAFYYLQKFSSKLPNTLNFYILISVVLILITGMLVFLRPLLTHWFLKLLKGKSVYKKIYQGMNYGATPSYLVTPLIVLLLLLTIYNSSIGISIPLTIFLICLTVIILAAEFYTLYLRITSISKIAKVSLIRSFLAIYIFPILTILLLETIIIFASVLFLI